MTNNTKDWARCLQIAKTNLKERNFDNALKLLDRADSLYIDKWKKSNGEISFLIGLTLLTSDPSEVKKEAALPYFRKAQRLGYKLPDGLEASLRL